MQMFTGLNVRRHMANDRAISKHFFVCPQREASDFVPKVDGLCQRDELPLDFHTLPRLQARTGNQAIVLRALKNEPGVGWFVRSLQHRNVLGNGWHSAVIWVMPRVCISTIIYQ